jgi:hypothetical protein
MTDQPIISLSSFRESRELVEKLEQTGWDVRHLKEPHPSYDNPLVYLHDSRSGHSLLTVLDYGQDIARTDIRFRNPIYCEERLINAIGAASQGTTNHHELDNLSGLVSTYILHANHFAMVRKYQLGLVRKERHLSVIILRHDRDITRQHALLLLPQGLLRGEVLSPTQLHSLAQRQL